MRLVPVAQGERFGRLVVLSALMEKRGRNFFVHCLCDCGKSGWFLKRDLRSKHTTSCGCFKRERQRDGSLTHGGRYLRIYHIWVGMKARCQNPKNTAFSSYGGRGITVCDRWLAFENFAADMGNPPSAKHSIERMNNNGNYEPGNCCWATALRQANNRKANKMIFFRGRIQSMADWARELNLNYYTMRWNLREGRDLDYCVRHMKKGGKK